MHEDSLHQCVHAAQHGQQQLQHGQPQLHQRAAADEKRAHTRDKAAGRAIHRLHHNAASEAALLHDK